MTLILALSASFLGSIGIIFESQLVREKNPKAISPASRLAFGALLNTLLLGVILVFRPEEFWFKPALTTVIALVSIGILDMLYNYLYLVALKKTPASKVTPIVALNPLFTLIVSSLFAGIITKPSIIPIVLIVVFGVYLLKLEKFDLKNLAAPFKSPNLVICLLSAFFTGTAAVIIDLSLSNELTSETNLLFIRMLIITLLSYGALRPESFPNNYKKINWTLILILIEFIYIGERLARTYAIGLGNVNLVVSIAGISPLFVLIFDRVFFKEKITLSKITGTILIIIGIIMAALQAL